MTGFWRPPYLSDFQICRGGGSSGSSTQYQTSTVQLPDWVNQASQANYANATDVAGRTYQPNPYAVVAPSTPDQQQAYSEIENLQGSAAPAYQASEQAASGLLGQVQPITTDQINTNTAALMNPYATAVVAPTVAQMRQSLGTTMGRIGSNAAAVGAFGGSRQGVEEGTAAAQEALGEGQLVGGLLSSGYNTAQTAAENLAGQNLGAGEWATSEVPQLATSEAGLAAQQAGLLEQAGRAEQGQSQAESDVAASNWQDAWNYPLEQQAILEQALAASPYGSTSTSYGKGTQTGGTNLFGNIVGGLTAGAGLLGAIAKI